MRLQPFGRMLPVHCCCEPNKRLGWVPVPDKRLNSPGPVRFMSKLPSYDLETGTVSPAESFDTIVEFIHHHPAYDGPQLAVNSHEVPVETWRRVPGFVEERA